MDDSDEPNKTRRVPKVHPSSAGDSEPDRIGRIADELRAARRTGKAPDFTKATTLHGLATVQAKARELQTSPAKAVVPVLDAFLDDSKRSWQWVAAVREFLGIGDEAAGRSFSDRYAEVAGYFRQDPEQWRAAARQLEFMEEVATELVLASQPKQPSLAENEPVEWMPGPRPPDWILTGNPRYLYWFDLGDRLNPKHRLHPIDKALNHFAEGLVKPWRSGSLVLDGGADIPALWALCCLMNYCLRPPYDPKVAYIRVVECASNDPEYGPSDEDQFLYLYVRTVIEREPLLPQLLDPPVLRDVVNWVRVPRPTEWEFAFMSQAAAESDRMAEVIGSFVGDKARVIEKWRQWFLTCTCPTDVIRQETSEDRDITLQLFRYDCNVHVNFASWHDESILKNYDGTFFWVQW